MVVVPETAAISKFVFSYPIDKVMAIYPEVSQISTQVKQNQGVYAISLPSGKTGLWQVSFDDTWNSRLYFSAKDGEFYRVRNDAWVMYDFFFRLHIMDYNTGEEFNNNLLRAFSILSVVVTITGIIMLIYSVRSRKKAVRLSQA